jgi:DNA repair exonuclease SbcCD ATPase subunit
VTALERAPKSASKGEVGELEARLSSRLDELDERVRRAESLAKQAESLAKQAQEAKASSVASAKTSNGSRGEIVAGVPAIASEGRLASDAIAHLEEGVASVRAEFDIARTASESVKREHEEELRKLSTRLGTIARGMSSGTIAAVRETAELGTSLDELRLELQALREEFNQRITDLARQTSTDGGWAPMQVVRRMSVNFANRCDDCDSAVAGIREFLQQLVTKKSLESLLAEMRPGPEEGRTAGGMRCLLCGRPREAVTGMIGESEAARLLGTPPGAKSRSRRPGAVVRSITGKPGPRVVAPVVGE